MSTTDDECFTPVVVETTCIEACDNIVVGDSLIKPISGKGEIELFGSVTVIVGNILNNPTNGLIELIGKIDIDDLDLILLPSGNGLIELTGTVQVNVSKAIEGDGLIELIGVADKSLFTQSIGGAMDGLIELNGAVLASSMNFDFPAEGQGLIELIGEIDAGNIDLNLPVAGDGLIELMGTSTVFVSPAAAGDGLIELTGDIDIGDMTLAIFTLPSFGKIDLTGTIDRSAFSFSPVGRGFIDLTGSVSADDMSFNIVTTLVSEGLIELNGSIDAGDISIGQQVLIAGAGLISLIGEVTTPTIIVPGIPGAVIPGGPFTHQGNRMKASASHLVFFDNADIISAPPALPLVTISQLSYISVGVSAVNHFDTSNDRIYIASRGAIGVDLTKVAISIVAIDGSGFMSFITVQDIDLPVGVTFSAVKDLQYSASEDRIYVSMDLRTITNVGILVFDVAGDVITQLADVLPITDRGFGVMGHVNNGATAGLDTDPTPPFDFRSVTIGQDQIIAGGSTAADEVGNRIILATERNNLTPGLEDANLYLFSVSAGGNLVLLDKKIQNAETDPSSWVYPVLYKNNFVVLITQTQIRVYDVSGNMLTLVSDTLLNTVDPFIQPRTGDSAVHINNTLFITGSNFNRMGGIALPL